MTTVCFSGVEKDISYTIYEEDEEEGIFIAKVSRCSESKTKTFPEANIAKKWINRMLDNYCSEQNEIDRFI